MLQLRKAWFAALGGVLLLTLTASGVFAARPADPGRDFGLATAANAISLHQQGDENTDNQDEDTDNQDEDETDTDTPDENPPEEDGTGNAHGACVSAVARGDVVLDGEYKNHGAMVSYAARVMCWQTEPTTPETSPTTTHHGPPAWVLERKAGLTTSNPHSNNQGKGKALGHSH